jgi:hypothetical protein
MQDGRQRLHATVVGVVKSNNENMLHCLEEATVGKDTWYHKQKKSQFKPC